MTQTAIIIKHRGEQVLVRLNGFRINPELIDVDTREHSWDSWCPVRPLDVEVRLEGHDHDTDRARELLERLGSKIPPTKETGND